MKSICNGHDKVELWEVGLCRGGISELVLLAGVLRESHCDLQAERHSAVVSNTSTIKSAYRDSFPVRCLAWKG